MLSYGSRVLILEPANEKVRTAAYLFLVLTNLLSLLSPALSVLLRGIGIERTDRIFFTTQVAVSVQLDARFARRFVVLDLCVRIIRAHQRMRRERNEVQFDAAHHS